MCIRIFMSPVWVFVIKQRTSSCKSLLRNHILLIAEQFKSVVDNGHFCSLVELSTIKSQPFLFHNTTFNCTTKFKCTAKKGSVVVVVHVHYDSVTDT